MATRHSPVTSQPMSAKTSAPSFWADCIHEAPSSSRTTSPRSTRTDRVGGGVPISRAVPTGAACPWVTMLRSRPTDIDTVTGECQSSKRRDRLRSTCSCSASVRQQKSP